MNNQCNTGINENLNQLHSTRREEGFALVAALLMLFLLSVVSIGMIYVSNSETRTYTSDMNNSRAYYATEAAMEKMMVDISNLFATVQSPTVSQFTGLGSSPPTLTGYSFPEYQIVVPTSGGNPTYYDPNYLEWAKSRVNRTDPSPHIKRNRSNKFRNRSPHDANY